jgi:hypothetical protein
MIPSRETSRTSMTSLEAAADAARSGFACMFSTSDEYERALVAERRAQGRYGEPSQRSWPMIMFAGCSLLLAGFVLLTA